MNANPVQNNPQAPAGAPPAAAVVAQAAGAQSFIERLQVATMRSGATQLILPPAYETGGLDTFREFMDHALYINGVQLAPIETVELKYISGQMLPMFPRFHHEVLDAAAIAALPPWEKADRANLVMLEDCTVWVPVATTDAQAMYGSPNSPFRLSQASIIYTAARNMGRWESKLCPFVVAVGYSLGLYQRGGPKIKREWCTDETVGPPSEANLSEAASFFIGDGAERRVQAMMDIIAMLGYMRISHTHPIDSTNGKLLENQLRLLNRLVDGVFTGKHEDLGKVTVKDLEFLLHGPVHGMSLGGACGFYRWWVQQTVCSKYLSARDHAVGDLWKSVAIVVAGYSAISSLPMLSSFTSALAERYGFILTSYLSYKGLPWRTSSLSKLICGEETVVIPHDDTKFIELMSALIYASAERGILPPSFTTSYYLKKVKDSRGGAVQFWNTMFEAYADSMRRLKPNEINASIVKMIADNDRVPVNADVPQIANE